MHPGITSHFTTMAPYLKVFPRRMHQHGWLRIMKSGFAIQLHYWKIYSQTWISKMSLITYFIESVVQMVHTALVTSCQAIGLGNKWYIFNLSLMFHSAYLKLLSRIPSLKITLKPSVHFLCHSFLEATKQPFRLLQVILATGPCISPSGTFTTMFVMDTVTVLFCLCF